MLLQNVAVSIWVHGRNCIHVQAKTALQVITMDRPSTILACLR